MNLILPRAVRCRPQVACESHKLQKSTAVGRKSWLFQGHLRPAGEAPSSTRSLAVAGDGASTRRNISLKSRLACSPLLLSRSENYCQPMGNLIRGTSLETGLGSGLVVGVTMKKAYTAKQGQYLAFIYYYARIQGRAPTEAEMQQYFQVSPPSVHQMVLVLVARGLIERTPGQARSIRLLIPREELPDLG